MLDAFEYLYTNLKTEIRSWAVIAEIEKSIIYTFGP